MTSSNSAAIPDHAGRPLVAYVVDSFQDELAARGSSDVRLGVWAVETGRFPIDDYEMGRTWLDRAERKRASSYLRGDLARSYEIAHAAARWVVGAATETPPAQVIWGRHPCPGCGDAHGRPRVEGAAVEFSLSHTPGWVLIAVADVPVGIDIEGPPGDPASLAKMMHPREATEIAAAGPSAGVHFARAWVRKEAYLKGLGIGLGRELHLDYLGADPAPSRRVGDWLLHDVIASPKHAAALAVLSDPVQ